MTVKCFDATLSIDWALFNCTSTRYSPGTLISSNYVKIVVISNISYFKAIALLQVYRIIVSLSYTPDTYKKDALITVWHIEGHLSGARGWHRITWAAPIFPSSPPTLALKAQ